MMYLSLYDNNSLETNDKKDLIYFDWIAFTKDLPGKGTAGYEANKKLFWQLLNKPQETVPVMVENPASFHRKTFVFEKGNRFTSGQRSSTARSRFTCCGDAKKCSGQQAGYGDVADR